jgi:hypothetical protein
MSNPIPGGFAVHNITNGIEAIRAHASVMQARTREYDVPSPELPKPIEVFGGAVSELLGQQVNTAILKRYDNTHPDELSGAYFPHPDPDRFVGRIALLSLDGFSYLFARNEKAIHPIECRAGTLVIADATLVHWVTPPLQGHQRHLLFYGLDITKKLP